MWLLEHLYYLASMKPSLSLLDSVLQEAPAPPAFIGKLREQTWDSV